MNIIINASENQKAILQEKIIQPSVNIKWYVNTVDEADAYIDLLFDGDQSVFEIIIDKPVIVNAVIVTCENLPSNFCRINAWKSYLEKDKLEVCTLNKDLQSSFESILKAIGYKCLFVSDIAGMVSARAIAMIINEAYFGIEDEISTKEQIDTAMKLGTNYPYGPFEWAEKIGIKNIAALLVELYKTDERYKPSDLLLKEANL
jgi:3-hydroxybutyryl-CoA dehydrogenase